MGDQNPPSTAVGPDDIEVHPSVDAYEHFEKVHVNTCKFSYLSTLSRLYILPPTEYPKPSRRTVALWEHLQVHNGVEI